MHSPAAVLLSVVSSLLVGVVLVFVPWTPLWDANQLIQPWPWVKRIVLSPFARGAVTGLGLVNLLLAFAELSALWRGRVSEE
jgi:hypothetical protein